MDPTLTPPPPALAARGPADLLGYVGHALGTVPDRSLVLLTQRGSGLRAVVRVDPPPASPCGRGPRGEGDAWAEAVAGVCRGDRGADGLLALLLDAAAAPAGWATPAWWGPFVAAAARVGLPVRHAWASDAVRLAWPLEAGPDGGCPEATVPVDPRGSDLSLHLLARGSVWGLRDRDLLVPPPAPQPPVWAAPDPADAAARRRWLAAWEAVLSGGPLGDAEALGAALILPPWRDALILQAALGAGAATVDPPQRERTLVGRTRRAPQWRRLDRLWEACRALVPRTPHRQAAQALAVAAWVSWARGHGSAAGAHLDAAAALDPADPFTSLLHRVVGAGLVAGWATDPATAWRP